MQIPGSFAKPHTVFSVHIRRLSTVIVGTVGTLLLIQSYSLTGSEMDWRISAGIAAVTYFVLGLLSEVKYSEGTYLHLFIGFLFYSLGIFCIGMFQLQPTDWARGIVLEIGIGSLFVAITDYLITSVRASALKKEREERSYYNELAVGIGIAFDFTLWEFLLMMDGLDFLVTVNDSGTRSKRVGLLLHAAKKMQKLPERFYLSRFPQEKAKLENGTMILKVAVQAADHYGFSNHEFDYLVSAVNVRTEPPGLQIDLDKTKTTVWEYAQTIVHSRKRLWNRVRPITMWDPLKVMYEIEKKGVESPTLRNEWFSDLNAKDE